LLAERTGTVINFGSLGGETSDIRLFPPRSLTLRRCARQLDAAATGAAQSRHCARTATGARARTLFEIAERYPPSRIADAVAHVGRAGRAGVVLIDFSKD
jgi:NADPH2:quinone reductase